MEIELKYRLSDKSYAKLFQLLSKIGTLVSTHHQTNYFFDSNNELEKKRITFRLRKAGDHAVMTMKGKKKGAISNHQIKDGISRVEELEHPISMEDYEAIVRNPSSIVNYQYDNVKELLEELQTRDIAITGHFENKRSHFQWNQLDLELDETTYDFGKAYELECEHVEPTKIQKVLEELFKEHGIEFGYSKRSKFGNMKAREVI
jgi:uncharacterized protein YjbK